MLVFGSQVKHLKMCLLESSVADLAGEREFRETIHAESDGKN